MTTPSELLDRVLAREVADSGDDPLDVLVALVDEPHMLHDLLRAETGYADPLVEQEIQQLATDRIYAEPDPFDGPFNKEDYPA